MGRIAIASLLVAPWLMYLSSASEARSPWSAEEVCRRLSKLERGVDELADELGQVEKAHKRLTSELRKWQRDLVDVAERELKVERTREARRKKEWASLEAALAELEKQIRRRLR